MRIDDAVAVVTGGASGLGAATVRTLAAHGARVVAFDLARSIEGATDIPGVSYREADVTDPEGLADHLKRRGIATGRHYPEPPHLSRAYASLGKREGEFPLAEAISRECLSLPLFPGLTEEQVQRVVDGVSAWFDG